MNRRLFLKITGLVAAASALDALPAAAQGAPHGVSAEPARALPAVPTSVSPRYAVREAGTYQLSGLVRLEAPHVEISGITNSQVISLSDPNGTSQTVVSFTTYEQFDGPGLTPAIRVRGGSLESLSVVPLTFQ